MMKIKPGDLFTDGHRTYKLVQSKTEYEVRHGTREGDTKAYSKYYIQDVKSGNIHGEVHSNRISAIGSLERVTDSFEEWLYVEYVKKKSAIRVLLPNFGGTWKDDKEDFIDFVNTYWNINKTRWQ